MQCIIDTISIKIEISNMTNTVIPDSIRDFVTRESDDIEKGIKKLTLNINRKTGKYKAIKDLKEFKKVLGEIMKLMSVQDEKKVKLDRLDIAIDNDLDFNENFKFFLMLFDLYTFNYSKIDRWYTTNLDTLKKNTIIWDNSHYEVVFYDKKEQSKGTHEFNTRMEFRFKRLSKMDLEKQIDKLIDNLKDIEENIPLLEQDMANRLIKVWKSESKNGKIKTFSEFVRKYDDYFYTIDIMKLVHKETGLKGSCTSWVKEFRKKNNLVFYKKTNVTKIKNQMIKSIKTYKKK